MAKMGQVHWHEGLFLQPHHVQVMQYLLGEQAANERRLTWAYPYGVVDYKLSTDALENMLVQFDRLRVVMPSGLVVNVPENADLPALPIQEVFESTSTSFGVHLGIPLWHASRANAIERGGGDDARVKRLYKVTDIEWFDENTGENPQPILLRRINGRLLLDDDDQTDLEVLPLLRIGHATGEDIGLPRQDPTFIPPCFILNGSPILRDLVRNLAHQIEATRGELVNHLNRGGAFSWEGVRGIQFEQVLRLRVLNRFSGRLRHLVQAPNLSPFEIYLELRDLLGGLAALYPDNDQFEVADYDHDNPGVCFHELCAKIRRLLRGTVAAPILRLPFRREANILLAELTDEHLTQPNEYFLGIKTKDDPSQVAKLVENPDEFKLMAKTLAGRAIFGVRLAEERYPPFGLPAETGLHYFRLNRAESVRMWERITQEKAMAIRFPGLETSDYDVTLYMTIPEVDAKSHDSA